METPQMLNMNEISNLYVMYNELCKISLNKKDYNAVVEYCKKVEKYFEIIYAEITNNQNVDEKRLEYLKLQLTEVKELETRAWAELKKQSFEEKIIPKEFDCFENALYCSENKELAYNNVSKLLYEREAYVSAINFLKKSLLLNPNNYENYRIMGDYYNKIKEQSKAIAYYQKYTEYNSQNPSVYNALGAIYASIDRYENPQRQIEYFKKAIELFPSYQDAIRNLAITYRNADKNEEAMQCFAKVLELEPTNDDYFAYACQKIKLGDFKQGWKYYEYRFKREFKPIVYPQIDKPRWDGKKNLEEKTLLVHYEQGFGDSIQFFRYLHQLKAKKIIFRVQDALEELLRLNSPNIQIVKKSTPMEDLEFDYHAPLMSLPYLLKARVDNIPLSSGYINADKEKAEKYKKEFFNNNSLKIGITWHGTRSGNETRDIDLENFYELARIKNVEIYSFQKNAEEELSGQLPSDVKIIDLGKTFKDFSDTAAAMQNIDLFVTSDNVVFNLAGAMGKKTFLLLNRDCEWRWMLDEDKTPWYDSVKIFKKKYQNDPWSLQIQRIIECIEYGK